MEKMGKEQGQSNKAKLFSYIWTMSSVVAKLRDLQQAIERGAATSGLIACVLSRCAESGDVGAARTAHSLVAWEASTSTLVANLVVQMYAECGSIGDARRAFESIRKRNVFSWTIMLAAFARTRHLPEAINLFLTMPSRSLVSWTTMMNAYVQLGRCRSAMDLLAEMDLQGMQLDEIALLAAADACGGLASDGLLQLGDDIAARIDELGAWSHATLTALLDMYGKAGDLRKAKRIFDGIDERGIWAWTAMLAAFARNGDLAEARRTFDKMPRRDTVAWNALLAGYAQNGDAASAVELFREMAEGRIPATEITSLSALSACAATADLGLGEQLVRHMARNGRFAADALKRHFGRPAAAQLVSPDNLVQAALMDFYGKCGSWDAAWRLFDVSRSTTSVSTWNAMITANATHGGKLETSLQLLQQLELEGMLPDKMTITSLLVECSRAGMGVVALDHFKRLLGGEYPSVEPAVEHYRCMVDLFARLGELGTAQELLEAMPFQSDVVAWKSLLSSCRVHGDLDRAAKAAASILNIDPWPQAPTFILLATSRSVYM